MKKSEKVSVPTPFGTFDMQAWHDESLNTDHVTVSKQWQGIPLVRLHSECLTGDIFGSYRCDCGEQLHETLKLISTEGGILIYLTAHEGRGIGLLNKLNAYKLQDEGVDTMQANIDLGFEADQRDYSGATEILKELGISRLKLLTNNPSKEKFLEDHGIEIVEHRDIEVPSRETNQNYLATKKERMHHTLKLDGKKHINKEQS
ncbi:MAG: GTP cyclohydrolase II [Micrococcaceae bacterium]